ncbi:MAG: cobyrinic acid a,c-diamide synthase [Nitrospinae bacterium CG11_big_fil_rev_8_21_14_0_20_45_15]|nr:MAG: cobyrinic acid a,c-diamide synthase [Nitrospinae bacterium CG11_big_fil_rev_8_21_14_0_20_45_15]
MKTRFDPNLSVSKIKDSKKYGFIVSATHSGAGKSSLTAGLMRLFSRKGYQVAPFKSGPDYIDPSHHERACSRPSYNLDTKMCSKSYVRKLFEETSHSANMVIAEGVMGLFDGASATNETGSTAQIAKLIGLPVLFVFNGSAMARSSAALVKGFKEFDPDLRFLGVVANKVNGARHAEMIRRAVESHTGLPFLGHLPFDPKLEISSRHLGLQLGAEQTDDLYERWADHVENHLDIKKILRLAEIPLLENRKPPRSRWNHSTTIKPFTVAVARDSAFQFIYQDTLDQFRFYGGSIQFFSPIADKTIPNGADWLYLPGGYPELFAKQLSENTTMRKSIRLWGQSGKPVVAECGGMMYLGKSLTTEEGTKFKMAGLFQFETTLNPKRMTLGYRDLKFDSGTKETIRLKGHEFHFSHFSNNPEKPQMTSDTKASNPAVADGYVFKNSIASYTHIYWGADSKWLKHILSKLR